MTVTAKSPGRINLIGEHTDYNDGFVMPAAIDKYISVTIRKNGHPTLCNAWSIDMDEKFSFHLDDIQVQPSGWQNYIIGITAELQKIGAEFTGFDLEFGGNVPIGAGLSSSAALQCSAGAALNTLFDCGFRQMKLIKAAQMSEHNYAGTKCGIMDMFASMMGKKNSVIRLDCKTLDYNYCPLDLGRYKLLLLNTNVSHSLGDSEYNTRREECEEAVASIAKDHPVVESLRDVDLQLLQQYKEQLRSEVFKRAKYVIEENERVHAAARAMDEKNFEKLGALIYASHDGLQNEYEVSCEELNFLVDATRNKDFIKGARMMGGGFGGCTLNLIEENAIDNFVSEIAPAYEKAFNLKLGHYVVSIGDGTTVEKID